MTTLTEFLLARIAEDEAAAREVLDARLRDRERSPADYGSDRDPTTDLSRWTAEGNGGDPVLAETGARALSECEVKRRIIHQHSNWETNATMTADYWSAPMDHVLECLALPYADHPDFRDEWR